MIRCGKKGDPDQINTFDQFGGDRQQEILEQSLQVYISEKKVKRL